VLVVLVVAVGVGMWKSLCYDEGCVSRISVVMGQERWVEWRLEVRPWTALVWIHVIGIGIPLRHLGIEMGVLFAEVGFLG
jgi:hypothetical protein